MHLVMVVELTRGENFLIRNLDVKTTGLPKEL